MSDIYDDSRYGVEKVLAFPGHCDNITAAGNVSHVRFREDITLLEFGIVVTEVFTAAGALATVQLREGATVLGSITIPSASAVGAVISTTTLTANNINNTNTLIFYRNASCLTLGECDGYIHYRERFVSG